LQVLSSIGIFMCYLFAVILKPVNRKYLQLLIMLLLLLLLLLLLSTV